MKKFIFIILFLPLILFSQTKIKSVVLDAMDSEMQRSMKELKSEDGIKSYFLSYSIDENVNYNISATNGVLKYSNFNTARYLDIDLRVGSYKLDNTHKVKERMIMLFPPPQVDITITDDPDAIKNILWYETEKSFREANEKYLKVKASKNINVTESDTSDDFSIEKPSVFYEEVPIPSIDVSFWENYVKKISAIFRDYPDIHDSYVTFSSTTNIQYFVSSEKSIIKTGRTYIRISAKGNILVEDGMELSKFYALDVGNFERIPNIEVIKKEVKKVIDQLYQLHKASITEPYIGPAILTGKASAVFFHEIFGHRVEGHRQKNDDEGQTFTKQLNEKILPDFISVYDDPTIQQYASTDLNGYYKYDDEGIKSQRVTIVENGILKNFLMSRSPIENFQNSNGHGRRSAGNKAVSRQGNLIVESSKKYSFDELKKLLVQECKKQNKPFGLLFDDNQGGFTMTGRRSPNAFKVIPVIVYKIYTDGRQDELIRGVDIIGTPLTCFSKIIATSNRSQIFNGFCGAESGYVPVSAISPDILVSEIEIQKKEKGTDKPPILQPPLKE
jgi:predicted Zn-dependent protease